MRSVITTAFVRVPRTGALEDRARGHGLQLERLDECVTRAHLILESHIAYGQTLYVAKIELSLPSAQIRADSLCAEGGGHQDIYVALQQAHDNAARQLRNLQRVRPTFVRHECSLPSPRGIDSSKVAEVYAERHLGSSGKPIVR